MELLAAAGGASFIVVCWVVGVKLLRVASRTRKLPETAVGLGLLLMGGIGYPLLVLIQQAPLAIELKRSLFVVHMLCHVVGDSALALFTYRVFRNGATWARTFLFGITAAAAATMGSQVVSPGLDSFILGNRGPWSQHAVVSLFPLFWTAIESLRYHRMMRRRAKLGMADPLVTDRFRLWAIGTLAAASISCVSVMVGFYGVQLATTAWGGLVIGPLGLLAGASMWVAFLPPKAYVRRRLRGRTTPAG